jgi:4,5-dihydroxyphthalate decarboxylase
LKDHPWVAESIFNAFDQAKKAWLATLGSDPADKKFVSLSKIVGADPLPYGLERNLPTIKALEDTAFKQQLTPRRMRVDELFVDVGR